MNRLDALGGPQVPLQETELYPQEVAALEAKLAVEAGEIRAKYGMAPFAGDKALRVRAAMDVFGGPGSGPRPGYKREGSPQARRGVLYRGSKIVEPLKAPTVELLTGGSPSEGLLSEMKASMEAVDEVVAAQIPGSEGLRDWQVTGALKSSSIAAVSGRMVSDPAFETWAKANPDGGDVGTQAKAKAKEYVETWATSSADHLPEAWAMQTVAAETFGGSAYPSLDRAGRAATAALVERDRVPMKAFLEASYAETQAQLSGVYSLTLARGYSSSERPTVTSTPTSLTPSGNLVPRAVEATMATNPLSSWSTDFNGAARFAAKGTSHSGVPKGSRYPGVVVAEVPRQRILSIPSSGPGTRAEHEVVVLGGDLLKSQIIPVDVNETAWASYPGNPTSGMAAEETAEAVLYLDAPPNDDWPKRTPDSLADIAANIEREASDPTSMAVAGLAASLGREMFGGPGSGPRPGYKREKLGGAGSYRGYVLSEPENPPAKEGTDPKVVEAAQGVRAMVVASEPAITRSMIDLALNNGGTLEGLDFRLKSEKSLARKIGQEADTQYGGAVGRAASAMSDVARYTMTFKDSDYVGGVKGTVADLESKGYVLRVKNYWEAGDPYQGINVAAVHPDGTKIEMQFHTPTSLDFKEPKLDPGSPLESQALHRQYERYRESTDPKERYQLYDSMSRISSHIPVPPPPAALLGIGTLKRQPFTPKP